MSVDQLSVDQISVYCIVDQMSVDQMSVDQMSVDQMSVDQLSPNVNGKQSSCTIRPVFCFIFSEGYKLLCNKDHIAIGQKPSLFTL
jgi:hypothetical protein